MNTLSRRALSAALVLFWSFQYSAQMVCAQQAPPTHTTYHQGNLPGIAGTAARNLNLTSTTASITAPIRVIQHSVNIQVGGVTQTVTSGQMLTPAEMVAASQVLH